MKIFLDTANLDELRRAKDWGMLDGVTTNPSLVAKEGVDFRPHIEAICALVPGPVSVETTTRDGDGMFQEGKEFATWAPNVVVKVPVTPEGLKACQRLVEDEIPVNVTLCFSANQVLLAAKAGAHYASIFMGRLDDIGHLAAEVVEQSVQIMDNFGLDTEVLAASLRHPQHVLQSALAGADVATMPFKVLELCFHHPLTEQGLEKFLADWAASRAAMQVKV